MRKLELLAITLFFSASLAACTTDAGDTLMTAFRATQAGDLPKFAETLTDDALTFYGNRAAMEWLRAQFGDQPDPKAGAPRLVSEETSGDPFGANGSRVDQVYAAEFKANNDGATGIWHATVKCAYLDKWRGYGRGVERMLISCKISRFE